MPYIKPKEDSKFRLFCFPYAGGGSSFFYKWTQSLHAEIEICPVRLPGREDRLSEMPFTNIDSLVKSLSQSFQPYLDIPFAFFGHSMGATLCFELAQYLWRHFDRTPVKLFVSGRNAPHIKSLNPPIHQLPTDEFLQELKNLDGTPVEVLDNVEIMEILMPALRADFELIETYQYRMYQPLPFPITAFGGIDDTGVKCENLRDWDKYTTSDFKLNMLSGNHFFLHTQQKELLSLLNQELDQMWACNDPQSEILKKISGQNLPQFQSFAQQYSTKYLA